MRNRVFVALVAAVVTAALPIWGAYLESGDSSPEIEPQPPPPRREVRHVPDVVHRNAVTRLISRVSIGTPQHYRNLTVFPLILRNPGRSADIRTLDEALSRDWLTIRERNRATVSELEVRNDSRDYVLLMAGEIIAGGKQNRMVRSDVLMPPRSRFIPVAVYCGEKERWTDTEDTFKSPAVLAHPRLRMSAAKGESQGRVWDEIDAQSKRLGVDSRTRDYRQVYEDKAVKERLDDCVAHFRRFCRPTTVGAVAVSGNRVLGCDIFSDPVLLSRLWNKLLRSYGVDVLHRRSRTTSHLTSRDVRRFLDRALSARYVEGRTPGVGVIIGISGQVDGEALVWDREAVHVGLFGDDIVYRDPPRPIPLPRPRPYPREQSLWPKEP